MLQTHAALSNVTISYGVPLPSNPDEWIWLGDVTGDQTWLTVGGTREEDYSLTVMVRAFRAGPNQQPATERAFQILTEIENALRTDPTVGGTVLSAQIKPTGLTELA